MKHIVHLVHNTTFSKIKINSQKIATIVYLVLTILVILFTYKELLIAPKNFIFGESNGFWNYGNILTKHSFLQYHQIGLWDNQVGLGYSFIGHQTAQFYPLIWLSYIIPDTLMPIRFLGILHLILGGLAFFYLLRTLKCNNLCSFLGSIIYICNAYVLSVVVNGIYAEIYNLIWMPLSVAFLWRALFYKRKIFVIPAGIALAMQVFAMTLFCFIFNAILLTLVIVFYALYSLFYQKKKIIFVIREVLVVLFLLFGTTVGISAIKLLPILEYKSLSMRDFLPYNKNWNFSTLQILWNYINSRLIPPDGATAVQKFVNFAFLSLLVLAFFKKSKESVCFIFVTLIIFLTLMGPHGGIDLYALFYYVVPGFKFNENTFRFIIMLNVSLAVLAGLGANYLYSKLPRVFIGVLVIIIVSQIALYTSTQMTQYVQSDPASKTINIEKNNLASKIAVLVHKNKSVVRVASSYIGGANAVSDYTALVYDFKNTNPLYSDFVPTYEYLPLVSSDVDKEFLRKKYKLFSLMSAKYVVAQKEYDDFPNDYIIPITKQSGGIIYETKSFLPFISEIPHATLLLGENNFNDFKAFEAKVLMLDEKADLTNTSVFTSSRTHIEDFSLDELRNFDSIVLSNAKINDKKQYKAIIDAYKRTEGKVVEINFHQYPYADVRKRSISIMDNKPALWLDSQDKMKYHQLLAGFTSDTFIPKSKIILKEYTPEKIQIIVDNPNTKTFLRFSESYFPGWHAFLDSKEIPIYMSDGLIKGFVISGQGKHTLLLTYFPDSFRFGSIITGVTGIMITCIFLVALRKRNNTLRLS